MAAFHPRVKSLRFSTSLRFFSFPRTRNLHCVSTPIPARFIPSHLDNAEDIQDYRPGGFHPISIGDCFDQERFKVLHKLGYGGSSTIWLARDQGISKQGRLVALKALRADVSSTTNPALTIPAILQSTKAPCAGIQFADHHFTVKGPNGTHLFLVSPFAGASICAMSDCPGRVSGSRRLRADLARKVAKQIVMTVNFMHSAGVVHGDITTANILFELKPHVLRWTDADVYDNLGEPETETVTTLDGNPRPSCAPAKLVAPIDIIRLTESLYLRENVVIIDFGQSYMAASRPRDYMPATLLNYHPPEARFEDRASFEADVWMLGCAIFEIRAGFPLFSSFFGSDRDILKQTVAMLGRLPDPWWWKYKERELYFEDDGEPKSDQAQESAGVFLYASKTSIREQLRLIGAQDDLPLSVEGTMIETTGVRLSEKEIELLGDLLEMMLRYRPEDRIGLNEVIMHPWLKMSES